MINLSGHGSKETEGDTTIWTPLGQFALALIALVSAGGAVYKFGEAVFKSLTSIDQLSSRVAADWSCGLFVLALASGVGLATWFKRSR